MVAKLQRVSARMGGGPTTLECENIRLISGTIPLRLAPTELGNDSSMIRVSISTRTVRVEAHSRYPSKLSDGQISSQ
eukprot:6871770-Pyramimonas_sp.AAC.2